MALQIDRTAEREKKLVALSSVVAAVFLTSMKLVVGLLTNSLGILSEAAHSGLDLMAALMTYFAVRMSDRPADLEHPYGHGKVENLSALGEALLLLGTCVWIIHEAVARLIVPVEVTASVWSFIVMAVSIVVDFTRSRALMKTARKHSSQALEADALHFSTDIWSSLVVILGLVGVWVGQWLREAKGIRADWLFRTDAIAALGVALIVVWVSLKLGRRTIDVLLDRASREQTEKVERAVAKLDGVSAVRRVRLRQSGPATFVDMTLDVPRSLSLEAAHTLATEAEKVVQGLLPRADVLVHVDPVVKDEGSLVERIGSTAARHGLGVHGIRAYDVRGRLTLSMHVEVLEDLTVAEAHEHVSAFEADLLRETPGLREIVTHIEPVGDAEARRKAARTGSRQVHDAVLGLPREVPQVRDCHSIAIHQDAGGLSVSFHCHVDPGLQLKEAHRLTEELEKRLRAQLPDLGRVVIHMEPREAGAP